LQEDWVLCRVFEKTKVDGGDSQDSDSAFSPPVFAGSSRVEPPPEPDHSASSGGGCYGYLPSQQSEVAVLPQYYYYGGGGADHHYGFPRDDAAGALPGFGLGGDGYGFGYFDMGGGGFGDVASLGGGMDFPEVWD